MLNDAVENGGSVMDDYTQPNEVFSVLNTSNLPTPAKVLVIFIY